MTLSSSSSSGWFLAHLVFFLLASKHGRTIHALTPSFVVPRGATIRWMQSSPKCFYSSTGSSTSSSSSLLRCSMVLDQTSSTGSTTSFDNNRWELPDAGPSSSSFSSSSAATSSSIPAPSPLSNKYKNMHEVNQALDQMAEACGGQQQQQQHNSPSEIIDKAAQAEELWNQVVQQHADALKAIAMTASDNSHNEPNESSTHGQEEEDAATSSVSAPFVPLFKPDVISFNTVLKAWSKTAQSLADYKQHSVLFGTPNNNNNPQGSSSSSSLSSRNIAITSIAVYTTRDAAERATMLLTQQEESAAKGAPGDVVKPDTTSYNIAIDAWAKSRVEDAPQAAERLLQRLVQTRRDIKPDSLTFNGLVDAWSYSGRPESLSKLEQLHEQMEDLYEQYEKEQGPDHQTANTVVTVTKGHSHRRTGDGSGGGSSSAGSLVVKPTIRTVNSILHAHAKRAQEYTMKDPALARRAADDARALLNRMTAKYEATQDVDYQPDVTSYSTVMDAYGRCAIYEATLEAESLLQELKALFQRTKNNQRHEPNIRTYTTLISAWAKVVNADEAPQRAQALLEEIKTLKHYNPSTQQYQPMYPNARTYLAVLQCWARSRDPTKAQRALQILLTMKDLYKQTQNPELRPNLVTYNAAIDACAKCQGSTLQQTDALKIAFAILKAIQAESDMQPNHVTFATLLKATAALMPAGEERNKVSTAVFSKAQQAGMVDYYTLANLRKAVEVYVLQSLLKDMADSKTGFIDYNKIPQPWCKNVLSLKQ